MISKASEPIRLPQRNVPVAQAANQGSVRSAVAPHNRIGRLGAAFAVVALFCGCGGGDENQLPRAAVSGTVTLDGRPLAKGVIRFVPIEGTPGPKTSVMVSEGRFESDEQNGPVVGKHRIEIESTDDGGYAMDDEQAIKKLKQAGIRRIALVRVPVIYNAHSTLTRTVAADGPNEFQFDLNTTTRR